MTCFVDTSSKESPTLKDWFSAYVLIVAVVIDGVALAFGIMAVCVFLLGGFPA